MQDTEIKFSKLDKKELGQSLAKLFFGLTRFYFFGGMTMGDARKNAFSIIKTKMLGKDKSNPVVFYLIQALDSYYKNFKDSKSANNNRVSVITKMDEILTIQQKNEIIKEANFGMNNGMKMAGEALVKIEDKIKFLNTKDTVYKDSPRSWLNFFTRQKIYG